MTRFQILCGALLGSALAFACTDAPVDASSTTAAIASADGGTDRPPPPRPPREAVDACAKSSDGDACAFDVDGHHVTGDCRRGPDGKGPLACAPDHPPGPPPKPPQEALDACAGRADADACSVAIDGTTIDGTCHAPPDGNGALACIPAGPPPT